RVRGEDRATNRGGSGLKGDLLFYFKVDELGGWESCGEPVGVIVLERCCVERIHHDTRPYSFVLAFENDDSRTYVLSAFSQPELDSWILAVRMSSYEGLKAMYYELTNKINTLTGKVVMQLLVSTAWTASFSVRTATDLGESWPFPVTVSS
ncbi:Sesquipedalian-1, partial [Geodia barretti]